eukprot:scpid112599/ scgid33043/ 
MRRRILWLKKPQMNMLPFSDDDGHTHFPPGSLSLSQPFTFLQVYLAITTMSIPQRRLLETDFSFFANVSVYDNTRVEVCLVRIPIEIVLIPACLLMHAIGDSQ